MPIRKTKTNPTVDQTLTSRAKTHGDFTVTADISQAQKDFFRAQDGYLKLNLEQREALDMIAGKIARILSGNPNEPDHWHDIGGYAKLAENSCE